MVQEKFLRSRVFCSARELPFREVRLPKHPQITALINAVCTLPIWASHIVRCRSFVSSTACVRRKYSALNRRPYDEGLSMHLGRRGQLVCTVTNGNLLANRRLFDRASWPLRPLAKASKSETQSQKRAHTVMLVSRKGALASTESGYFAGTAQLFTTLPPSVRP